MKWQRYTTKTNEADVRRVMIRKAAADGRRYKLTDEKRESPRFEWDRW